MKQMKQIILAVVLLTWSITAFAQDLLQYVPSDVTILAGMSPNAMKSKVNMDRVKKMEFYDFMMQEIKKEVGTDQLGLVNTLIENPEAYGMGFYDQSYFFMNAKEDGSMMINFIFKLTDRASFESFYDKEIASLGKLKAKKMANYTLVNQDGASIAWNDDILLVTTATEIPDFEGEDVKDFKGHVTELIGARVESIINNKGSNSIVTNSNFLKAGGGKANDAFMWMDYSYFAQLQEMMGNTLNQDPMTGALMESMMRLYDDNYLMMGLKFFNGNISLDTKYIMNDELNNLLSGMTDANINPRFARYVPKDNILGYYALALNVEKSIKGFAKMFEPAMGSSMPDIDQTIEQGIAALGLNMTATDVYNMFKGDMLIAFTGMRDFEKEVTTYEYDEDFNRSEVKEMKKETLPEFTMMMSYTDEGDIMPLIQMGVDAGVVEKYGNHFKVSIPSSPMDMQLAMHKGVMFLTNNEELITNNLKRGFKRKHRLGKQHLGKMVSNSQVFYWDINKTLAQFSDMASAMGGPSGDQLVNIGRQNVESMWMTAGKVQNKMMDAKMDFNFTNNEINSLEQIFELINDLYLSFSNEQRM